MANLNLPPDMEDPSCWFLDILGHHLGLSVDSRTDKITDLQVVLSSSCGTTSTMHTFVQQQLPTALDLVRRLRAIPQFHDVYAAITLERKHVYTGIVTLRNCLYFHPGEEYDTVFHPGLWKEEGWYST